MYLKFAKQKIKAMLQALTFLGRFRLRTFWQTNI